MEDGSSNILNKNSLTDYEGNYEQGEMNGQPFPADVFLLNPPYSEKGKGFIFVEKALKRMNKGRAAILIQENAGCGKGLPYTQRILKHNKLLASIHMPDIFKGKSNVQTAIYLFEVGTRHETNDIVTFIDFSNDGYTRTNRRKSSQRVNLRDTDHAAERYQEIVDIVLGKEQKTHYYDNYTIKDTIDIKGKDWLYQQHVDVDVNVNDDDFCDTVNNYISWEKGKLAYYSYTDFSELDILRDSFKAEGGLFEKKKLEELFEIKANPQLDKGHFRFSDKAEYPYFTRTEKNNGILGYVDYLDKEHLIKGNSLAIGMIAMQFFYMEHDFYAGQFTKTAFPKFEKFNKIIALYFITALSKHKEIFKRVLVGDFEDTFNNACIEVPYDKNGNIAYDYIEKFIKTVEILKIKELANMYKANIQNCMNICGLTQKDCEL